MARRSASAASMDRYTLGRPPSLMPLGYARAIDNALTEGLRETLIYRILALFSAGPIWRRIPGFQHIRGDCWRPLRLQQ